MAFATVVASASGNSGGATTSHSVTLPAGSTGEHYFLVQAFRGTVTNIPSGWAALSGFSGSNANLSICISYKLAATNSASSTSTTTGSSVTSAYICYRISGFTPPSFTDDRSTGADPQSPELDLGTADDYLWLTFCAWVGDYSCDTFPSLDDNITDRYADSSGLGVAGSFEQLNQATYTPSPFGLSGSTDWWAITLAAPAVSIALGVATESDTAPALTVDNPRSYLLGVASETDSALAIAVDNPRTYALGVASEADSSLAVTVANPRSYALGLASEADSALSLSITSGSQSISLGVASEADSALAVAVDNPRSYALGLASETDSALALSVSSAGTTVSLGVATETDSGLALTVDNPGYVALGVAEETDSALSLTIANPRTYSLGVASESDTSPAIAVSSDCNIAYIYNGSAWVKAPAYIYNGSAWVLATTKSRIYNGSTWAGCS